jgi:hypothetical protein
MRDQNKKQQGDGQGTPNAQTRPFEQSATLLGAESQQEQETILRLKVLISTEME